MPASDQHPEYRKYSPRWAMVRDCVSGSDEVKSKGTDYLPQPNPSDRSEENKERYRHYVQRASFINFTGSTLDGLLGMVFRRAPVFDIAPPLQYLEYNATGSGITLEQTTRSAISQVLQCGRLGLLVDYPQAPDNLSAAEVSSLELAAHILPYKAETVVNWQTTVIAGRRVLSMVVLKEDFNILSDDGFSYEVKPYHRVLKLEDRFYVQCLYNNENEIVERSEPRMANGARWAEIPFIFVGAANNDELIDKAPLYDIATANIAHYRNSADFEESSFIVGQPTPVFAGLTQSWVDDVLKGGVLLGSRTAVLLPENASANLLQADPNSMPQSGMKEKEIQMVKIGARIIEDSKGNETAEAARMRYAGQTSKLAIVVANVEEALELCMEWCAMFMGSIGENEITINREYYDKRVDPQVIMAELALYDRGLIASTDLRANLRASGRLAEDRTDEDIDAEAEITEIL